MLFPARTRTTVTRIRVPMAVPMTEDAALPIGARLASGAQGLLAQARTEAVRRIVVWLLVTACVGVLGLAYLFETSHVASLASQRATLEDETAKTRDVNARLAAQAAGFQTLSRADTTARDQGLMPATPRAIVYLTLPDVTDAPPTAAAAPSPVPGLRQRIVNALTGRARAENNGLTITATPGAKP
ncbi:MAG: hypothetical protein M3Y58_13010 [Chloroflexota bacterium]|nr:hypothetical protein [Chloroflexota bacterium]